MSNFSTLFFPVSVTLTNFKDSSIWDSTYTTVSSNSGFWKSSYTTTNANSAKWESVYTTVNTGSASNLIDGGNIRGANIAVGTRDGYHVALRSNNGNRVWILSSGEVGIGPSLSSLISLVNSSSPNSPRLTVSGILSTNDISASGAINALSSNVGIVVNSKTDSYTLTNDDNNRIIHFNTSTQSLCAIIPASLRTDFNCAVMNTGTNILELSTYQTLRATGTTITTQYGAAFVYKDSANNVYAVGRL